MGGNWKMNLDRAGAVKLASATREALGSITSAVDVVLFPSFTLIEPVATALAGSAMAVGAQDCSAEALGAFTGQVSCDMVKEAGATWCVIGHSERRHGLAESDDLVGEKVLRALGSGMKIVLCVGETKQEREAGHAHQVNVRQLRSALVDVTEEHMAHVVVAYEPVWAIGTGLSASPQDAQDAHHQLRRELASLYNAPLGDSVRIVYGGSLNPANASTLCALPDVDGGLVGGASLKVPDFLAVCAAAAARTAANLAH